MSSITTPRPKRRHIDRDDTAIVHGIVSIASVNRSFGWPLRSIGRTTFRVDVPLHLAMKRSPSDKPIIDSFSEDLSRAFNIKAIALVA